MQNNYLKKKIQFIMDAAYPCYYAAERLAEILNENGYIPPLND